MDKNFKYSRMLSSLNDHPFERVFHRRIAREPKRRKPKDL
jgi:hypothetical protein